MSELQKAIRAASAAVFVPQTIMLSAICERTPVRNPSGVIGARIGTSAWRPWRGTCPSTISPADWLCAACEFHIPWLPCHVRSCSRAWTSVLPALGWAAVSSQMAFLCYLFGTAAVGCFVLLRLQKKWCILWPVLTVWGTKCLQGLMISGFWVLPSCFMKGAPLCQLIANMLQTEKWNCGHGWFYEKACSCSNCGVECSGA